MLKIENLTVNADNKEILREFDLEINDGEIHALLGPNGAGKSSICKAILNEPNYQITRGTITFNGNVLNDMSTTDISRLGISMISQSPIAIEGVTNAEMLRIALSEKTNERVDVFAFNKKMEKICEKIQLPKSFIHRSINDGMSGGERKKNELLHLWMLEPSFIILDEVDSGLDVDALKIVGESLKEYYDEKKCSILIITHNSKLLDILVPDKVHILDDKKIVRTGDKSLVKEIEEQGFKSINKTDELGDNK